MAFNVFAKKKSSFSRIVSRFITLYSLPVACFATTDDMQLIDRLWVDRSEVTINQFARFVEATGTVTQAEQSGGGSVYDGGWQRMPGWHWRAPFGAEADDRLPAVHITFDEAEAYCHWADKRLPTEAEWRRVAYTELRPKPTGDFETNTTYPYPTGETSIGANCLDECGDVAALDFSDKLSRGTGPALAASTRQGVNGLYDMGANVWEWVDLGDSSQQGTLGGSWWYGRAQMHRDHSATKSRDMAAVYIGFRCVRD